MKKSDYKLWKKHNDEKKQRENKKKKYYKSKKIRSYNNKKREFDLKILKNKNIKKIKIKIPAKFSILYNSNETIKPMSELFNKIEEIINEKENKKYFFHMDFSDVEYITIDAIMYLISLLQNTRKKAKGKIYLGGNFPKNKECKEILKQSGFIKFIQDSYITTVIPDEEEMRIVCAKDTDTSVIANIMRFIGKKLKLERKDTLYIKDLLDEIIDNSVDHAYNEKMILDKNWYIFIQDLDNKICITLLDNGLGICNTMYKNALEKANTFFKKSKDYRYIESALNGEYRTETGLGNRGHGLPEIKRILDEENILNFTIVSYKAYYSVNKKFDMTNELKGTMYYFEIEKE